MTGLRVLSRWCAYAGVAILCLTPHGAFGQAGPILGSAPVRTTPSAATPLIGDSFTVDVAIDLTATTGTTPAGVAPAAVTAFRVPLTFDNERLELTAVGAGADPSFATAGFDATSIAEANATGQLIIAAAQSGTAPTGVVSIATLSFDAKTAGAATIAANSNTVSLASAIQTRAATLFGPAPIPVHGTGGGVVVQTPPTLRLVLQAGPSPVTPDGQIIYLVRCESVGGSPARGITVRVTLPAGVVFSAATEGAVQQGSAVEWTVGELAPTAAFEATLAVNVSATSGTTLNTPPATAQASNAATVTSAPVAIPVSASAPIKPGMIVAGASYGYNAGAIFDVTSGKAVQFARMPSGGWLGALLFTPTGRLFAASDYAGGSLFDVSTGGDLTAATPIVRGLGHAITGLTRDGAGNLYVSSLAPNTKIRKVSPAGTVTMLPRAFNYPGDVLAVANTLYVSEGATGTIWRVDLATGQATAFATGFTSATTHFSGQLTRNSQGRLLAFWGNSGGPGLFDFTAGGSMSAAQPLTARGAFRIDVNDITTDSRDHLFFAGDGSGKVWRAPFANGVYGTTAVFADGVSDTEVVAVYPLPNLALLALTTSASADPAVSGRQLTYTITAENRGGAGATNATLTAALPTGATFVSASDGGTLSGDTVTWTVASIASGATVTRTFLVNVTAGNGATLAASPVTIAATGVATVTGALPRLQVVTPPDLRISVSAPASVPTGAHITYTINYSNAGGSAAENTVIDQNLPASSTFVTSETGVFTTSTSPDSIKWTLGTLNAGQSGSVTFVVRATGTAGSSIVNNSARISATLVPAVTAASVSTLKTAASPLTVTVRPAPNPVVPGTQINTLVTWRNTGTTAQTNVTVTVRLPQPITFLSITGGGVYDGTNATWTIPTLAAGAQTTARVSFRTRAEANTAFTIGGITASAQAAPAAGVPVVVRVQPYPAVIQPGVILSAVSFGTSSATGRVTAVSSPTVRQTFGETDDEGWIGPLLIAPDGHVYAATAAENGAVFDITPGGDLRTATPIATNLGEQPSSLVMDSVGNIYCTGENADARVRRISPEGDVTPIGPAIAFGGGIVLDEEANVLYVAEGSTGTVHRADLTTGASTVFATGFFKKNDHFSGQLVRTRQGRLYMLWGNESINFGLFDITAGGDFTSATPVTAKGAFRIDVNQMTIGPNDDIYMAGNDNKHIFRAPFLPATQTYGPTVAWALNLGDNESIGIFPAFRLTITGAASVSHLNRGESATFTFDYANASTAAVHNSVVEVPLPDGFTLTAASAGGVVQDAKVRWTVGTLEAGEGGSVTVTGTIDTAEGSTFAMTGYTVTADGRATATGPAVNVLVDYPLSIQVRANPDPVVAGQDILYTLRYENLNAAQATNVVVRAEVPAGTTFLAAANGGSRSGSHVTWNLPNVAGGSKGEVSFTVRANAPPAVTLADYSIASQQLGTRTGLPITTTVLPLPVMLAISATAAPDPVTAGTQLTYSIHYANDGGSPATGAVVRAEVPPSTRFAFSQGGGTLAGNEVVWQLGTVASLTAGDLSYTVIVDEAAAGTIVNDAVSVSAAQQSATATPVVTRIVAPPPPAPLAVTLVAEPSPVSAGALLTYRIEVTNVDSAVAHDVVVVDAIPEGTSLVSTTGPATAAGDTIQWTLGDLAAGDTIVLGIVVRAPATTGSIVNEGAVATSTGRDASRSEGVTTQVVAPAATLQLRVNGPESVIEGGTISYTLAYENEGPSAANEAAIDMPLPAGTTLESSSPQGTLADGVVTWEVGKISAGRSGSVGADVRVQLPAGSTVANSGSQLRAANAPAAQAETLLTDVVAPPTVFTGTLTTNKSAYVAPEAVQQLASLTYAGGGSGIAGGLTALLETTNATGTIVASHAQSIDAIASGDTAPVTFTWPADGASTGAYEVTFTVNDAAGTEIVRLTKPFTISAPDGAKLTGTITPTNSPVPLGSVLEVDLAVQNGSAVAYIPLPLEVAILDPETLEVLTSSPVSNFDVPANGSATRLATLATAGLALGTYPVWLTTSAGGGRLLDTDEVTIVAPLLTLSPTAQSIVAGTSATLTVALSAPAAQPVPIAIASSNGSIVTAPATVTIAAGTTSQTFTVQGSGAGGPVTLTATLPASLGGASATATVTVLLSGQLTATLEVFQGEDVSFGVAIANGGSNALVDGSFAIELRNGESGALVDTIPFTATIGAGSTFTHKLTYTTSDLAAQRYEARLIWYGLVPPQLLASAPFDVVEPPPLRIEAALGAKARVVIWTNCSPGNSKKPCDAVKPPFLTATLDAAGIPYVVVGEQTDFLDKVRTGAFSAAIVDQSGANEVKIAAELVADVHAGIGLFFIHSATNAMPKLSPALGTTFGGKLLGPTVVQLQDTPFTTAGALSLNGDGAKIAVTGARTVGTIGGTDIAAIVHHSYGTGRSVTVPFDLELTPTAAVAKLIVGAVQYVSRTHATPLDARAVVPLHVQVTTPPGGEVPVTVPATLPSGAGVVAAVPPLTSQVQWSVSLQGNTTAAFDLWVRVPDAAATSTVSFSAALTGGPPIETSSVTLTVAADAAALRAQLQPQLAALQTAALTNQDVKALKDAVTELAAMNNDALANVARVLSIVEKLQGLSPTLDARAARATADRLLLYWQSRVGA
ncbi:MAG TPA: hypothetical protein VGF28_24470 [Thermoanaerobaculia bacterium]